MNRFLLIRVFVGGFPQLLNRKNCCLPEMGLVKVLSPLTTTGGGELVVQTGKTRLVV
jgi:hypothetical protein